MKDLLGVRQCTQFCMHINQRIPSKDAIFAPLVQELVDVRMELCHHGERPEGNTCLEQQAEGVGVGQNLAGKELTLEDCKKLNSSIGLTIADMARQHGRPGEHIMPIQW